MTTTHIKHFNSSSKRVLLAMSVGVMSIMVYLQALHPLWRGHLEVDIWSVWYRRATQFLQDQSFINMQDTEYFPAVLWWFILPTVALGKDVTYMSYLQAVWIVNLLIAAGMVYLCVTWRGYRQAGLLVLLLLALGPIWLFRFDLLVVLLILLSVRTWGQGRMWWSGMTMGSAMGMKIFPVVLLPYLGILWWRRRAFKKLGLFVAGFGLALGVPLVTFLGFGGSFSQIAGAWHYHALKYVSVESVMGSITNLVSWLTEGKPRPLLGGYGIWGVGGVLSQPVLLRVINYVWMVPVGIFYVYVWRKSLLKMNLVVVVFWVMLLLLVFAKNLHPQYVLWFALIYPFFPWAMTLKKKRIYWIGYGLLLLMALLNQLVYPLLYTDLIESFHRQSTNAAVFGLLLWRNASIVSLLFTSWRLLRE